MATGATVDDYLSILGEDHKNDSPSISSKEEQEFFVSFEDITEIQDALADDSSDPGNKIVQTSQLRRHSELKQSRPSRKFEDIPILLRRRCRQDKTGLTATGRRLEVQSQALGDDLRQILEDKNGDINWDSSPIKLESPFYILFFHRHRIEAFSKGEAPSENRERMCLVHDFIHRDEGHKSTLKQYHQHVSNGKITFEILWTIYSPNSILIHNMKDIQECLRCIGVPRLVVPSKGNKFYVITVQSLDFDGTYFGAKRRDFRLENFPGAREISSPELPPLEGHPGRLELEKQMKQRYMQFLGLVLNGHSHKHSRCLARVTPDVDEEPRLDETFQVKGRVIIDHMAHFNCFPSHQCDLTEMFDLQQRNETTMPLIPEAFKMLCPARVPGFSLHHQRWGCFLIDEPYLSDIEWEEGSMRHLVMEKHKKDLIQALVKGCLEESEGGRRDVVAGKGRGLFILLHGPPGLGKTLLAECLSEHTQRPLYRVTATNLTINPSELEQKLGELFNLGNRWKTLLLLDEAEFLIASPTKGNFERNVVVAAFLHALEFYDGILILTTNKPNNLDEAIHNRIHIKVSFDPITSETRRIIWQSTLDRVSTKDDREGLWTDELLDALSEVEVSGREINNITRLATY